TLNLNISFLHDVEQTDLDLSSKIWKFIDGKDSPIGAGQQAIVHAQLATNSMSALGGLDWIDISDDIGTGHVLGCKLLHVPRIPRTIFDGRPLSDFLNQIPAPAANRLERVVVDLATGNHRNDFIQQRSQLA